MPPSSSDRYISASHRTLGAHRLELARAGSYALGGAGNSLLPDFYVAGTALACTARTIAMQTLCAGGHGKEDVEECISSVVGNFAGGWRKPCRRTNWQRPPGTLALRLISVLAPLLVTAAASPASAHAGAMGPGALLTVHGGWAVYVCVCVGGEGSVTIGIGASLVHMDSSSGLREGDELQWYEVLDEKHEFHACMTASPRYEGGGVSVVTTSMGCVATVLYSFGSLHNDFAGVGRGCMLRRFAAPASYALPFLDVEV